MPPLTPDKPRFETATVYVKADVFCDRLGIDLSGGWRLTQVYVDSDRTARITLVRESR